MDEKQFLDKWGGQLKVLTEEEWWYFVPVVPR